MENILNKFTSAFPIWVIGCSALALWQPSLFSWFSGLWITIGLGVIMLGMGITLTAQDFTRILQMPGWVLPGVILHYTIMPLSGWALAKLLALPDNYAVGLILVACCPCGTASNVISYLSRANVALSVTLTTFSTVLAVVLDPMADRSARRLAHGNQCLGLVQCRAWKWCYCQPSPAFC